MGIPGLLPLLKPITREIHLSEFSGQTVGVDTYCWLHKGAYGCALDIVEGKETKFYLNYVIKRLEMMLYHNIKPYLVLDGGHLPSKANKEAERRKSRQENKAKGVAFLRAGNKSQACECFQKCIDITPEMALEVIKLCRQRNINYIVAPYEADSQLAYLMKSGITQATISEDSDLLVFGCKKVIFKMDEFGNGFQVDLGDLPKLKDLKMNEFTLEKFRHMCILSGCDYLPSIKGIGLKTANKLIRKHSTITKLVRSIRMENKLKVPDDYEKDFKQADETFLYQLVFDPIGQCITPLTALPDGISPGQYEFAGPFIPKEKAVAIAIGNVNPITHKVMDGYDPVNDKIDSPNGTKKGKTTHAFKFSNKSSSQQSLTSNKQKHCNNGKNNVTTTSQRFLLPPLNRTNLKEEDELMKMYTSLKEKSSTYTELKQVAPHTISYSQKHRLKNPFRMKNENQTLTGHFSCYFATTKSHSSDESLKPTHGDENNICKEEQNSPPLPSIDARISDQETVSTNEEQEKKGSPTLINIGQDSQLNNDHHKDSTHYGIENNSITPVANKLLRLSNARTNPFPTSTTTKTFNKFVYKPRVNNNHEEMIDQDSEVTDSGYLSDSGESSLPVVNEPNTELDAQKIIQIKPEAVPRHSGLSRCKSLGISKRKAKTNKTNGTTTLLSYFEYDKRKKIRLDG